MSPYIMLVFAPIVIYYFYSFWKTKLDLYLMLGTIAWYGMFHIGEIGLYQLLQQPLKSIIDFITGLLALQIFVLYVKKAIQDCIEYKEFKK